MTTHHLDRNFARIKPLQLGYVQLGLILLPVSAWLEPESLLRRKQSPATLRQIRMGSIMGNQHFLWVNHRTKWAVVHGYVYQRVVVSTTIPLRMITADMDEPGKCGNETTIFSTGPKTLGK